MSSWLNNRNCLLGRKSGIHKYLKCGSRSGTVKQMVNKVITVILNLVVVNLSHLRPKNRRRKPL
jgi:hypothetical protein